MAGQLDRISIDPRICGGKPYVKGTRMWVSLILDFLANGTTEGELLAEYPQLRHEDVLAAIAYGAQMKTRAIHYRLTSKKDQSNGTDCYTTH
jgi:uncharacterized protein (DUF433 family)